MNRNLLPSQHKHRRNRLVGELVAAQCQCILIEAARKPGPPASATPSHASVVAARWLGPQSGSVWRPTAPPTARTATRSPSRSNGGDATSFHTLSRLYTDPYEPICTQLGQRPSSSSCWIHSAAKACCRASAVSGQRRELSMRSMSPSGDCYAPPAPHQRALLRGPPPAPPRRACPAPGSSGRAPAYGAELRA